MKKGKISVWYDKEGDYLEITLRRCKDTYFQEIEKDVDEIRDKRTDAVVGYAVFNFTKKRSQSLDIPIAVAV